MHFKEQKEYGIFTGKNNHSISLGQNQVILDITTEKRYLVQVAILFIRNEDISKLLQSVWYLM